ncbi:MAG: SsrA-binding protein SmpB [Patescibacteria group bacterium]
MPTYSTHRKAHFDYDIIDTIEAGLVLRGFEVKAVRAGKARLEGAYVIVRGKEAFVANMHIAPYQAGNTEKGYDPERPRKLLLNQKEITQLERETETAGLTVIPLKLYADKRTLKLEIALVRGKKKYDKRETIKKRDSQRDTNRLLKSDSA